MNPPRELALFESSSSIRITIASVPTGHDRLAGMIPTSVVAAWAGAADTVRAPASEAGSSAGTVKSRFLVSLPPHCFMTRQGHRSGVTGGHTHFCVCGPTQATQVREVG